MSESLMKTENEKNKFVSHAQNTGSSLPLNKYAFKTGILHKKLNVSKSAVISYSDFTDLIDSFSDESAKPQKEEFDKQLSQFVQEWEQNTNNSKYDIKPSITNYENILNNPPPSPVNDTSSLNGRFESEISTTRTNDDTEYEVENKLANQENSKKISMDNESNDIRQDDCFEKVIICKNSNISISCTKNSKKQLYINNNQQETNVIIFVIDWVNDLKKQFVCPKKLLLEQMEVFSEINTKNYSLKDIVIHCNMNTFGWLMHWMKEGSDHTKPVISFYNVIHILKAANFFKILPLVEQCIIFIRLYINNVIEATEDFSNVSNQLIIKLTELFSNSEVENIIDENDKLQTILYCNLILFLANQKPKENFNHFSSLTNIFCCKFCHKILPKDKCFNILCRSDCNIVTLKGVIKGLHKKDKTWNLANYVKVIYEKLHSWRLVYWHLWGTCHFLFCSVCQMLYPLCQAKWCPYHPGEMEYFKIDDEGNTIILPIGRYECCGQRIYKYECIKNPNCCSYKNHVPVLKSSSEIEINNLFIKHQELISLQPPQNSFPESLTQLIRSQDVCKNNTITTQLNNFWWFGIQLIPKNFKHPGPLISKFWEETLVPKHNKSKSESNAYVNRIDTYVSFSQVCTPQFTDEIPMKEKSNFDQNSLLYSSPKTVSEVSSLNMQKSRNSQGLVKKKKTDESFIFSSHALVRWNIEETIRYNQDNQRDYEDWAFSKIVSNLTPTNYGTEARASIFQPSGGSYFRIMLEWKEKHRKQFRKFDKKTGRYILLPFYCW